MLDQKTKFEISTVEPVSLQRQSVHFWFCWLTRIKNPKKCAKQWSTNIQFSVLFINLKELPQTKRFLIPISLQTFYSIFDLTELIVLNIISTFKDYKISVCGNLLSKQWSREYFLSRHSEVIPNNNIKIDYQPGRHSGSFQIQDRLLTS